MDLIGCEQMRLTLVVLAFRLIHSVPQQNGLTPGSWPRKMFAETFGSGPPARDLVAVKDTGEGALVEISLIVLA